MSYKAAFFDIDWTLYDHKNHGWDHKSLEAVSHLKEKGIECFLCSARPLDSMTDLGVFQLGIDWRGYVASAGAVTVMDGKTLKAFMMKEADVVNFIRLVHYLHVSASSRLITILFSQRNSRASSSAAMPPSGST